MPLTTVINKIEDLEKNQQKVELQTKIDLKKYQKFKKEQQKQEKEIKKEQKKVELQTKIDLKRCQQFKNEQAKNLKIKSKEAELQTKIDLKRCQQFKKNEAEHLKLEQEKLDYKRKTAQKKMESEQAKMYNMLAINIENNVILQDCEIAEFHPQAAVEKLFAEINLVAEINKSSTAINVMESDHQLEKLNVEEIKLEAKIAELQLLKGEKIESLQQNKEKLAKLNIEKKERQQFENEENKIKTKKYQNS